MTKLDHIMYAAPDLDQGIAEIADLLGVTPAVGGTHPGMGTRNALLSLGPDQYLEIIAPDPQQDLEGTLGNELIRHGGSGIRSWAVAANDLAAISNIASQQGLDPQPIIDMNRTTPAGVRLDWQLCMVAGNKSLPFFIDWKDSPHPALTTPSGCTLVDFSVSAPDDHQFQTWMDALGIAVTVVNGEVGLSAQLQTPTGVVELAGW